VATVLADVKRICFQVEQNDNSPHC